MAQLGNSHGNDAPPPPYEPFLSNAEPYMSSRNEASDPRTSSMQSLVPPDRHRDDTRRRLLLIYIHGFMGAETSFQSFPAHVHNLVSITLADTHIVHTKIYPRYKSRQRLEVVAEDFSQWLEPHLDGDRDIVLLGHSMGGLLSSEVVLLRPKEPGPCFRHRILGTVNFDVPFLGMHPSVIGTGIASLFKSTSPKAESPAGGQHDADSQSSFFGPVDTATSEKSSSTSVLSPASSGSPGPSRQDTLFSQPSDPNYNPSFTNDVNIPIRKGWKNTMHFITKHSDGLRKATKQYVKAHAEFGGAMANYSELRARYNKIRSLEESEERERKQLLDKSGAWDTPGRDGIGVVPRVRFINYYTACHGRTKKPKETLSVDEANKDARLSRSSLNLSRSPSPSISVEEVRDTGVVHVALEEPFSPTKDAGGRTLEPLQYVEHEAMESSGDENVDAQPLTTTSTTNSISSTDMTSALSSLHVTLPVWPPLSPPPTEPAPPNLSLYSDKTVQEALKREHERRLKSYKQEMKDREAILADRQKVEEKIRKAAAKEEIRKKRGKEKEEAKVVDDKTLKATQTPTLMNVSRPGTSSIDRVASTSPPPKATDAEAHADQSKPSKPPKDRHFCVLPSKDASGNRDYTWVRVFMPDMDEVQAHCGLFTVSEEYERLVGDVGDRIERWVRQADF
jgi:pimeloyl-ACP methyl ester carboxylesterase